MNNNFPARVVVTGLGVICPLGLDTRSTWEALIQGKSGIAPITHFDPKDMKTKFAGEAKGFEATNYLGRKEARHMDRFTQMAVVACQQAVAQSGLKIDQSNEDSIGVIVGSGIGGLSTLFDQVRTLIEKGPDRVSPFLVPMMITDMAASQISISLGLKGPNLCVTSACSSGTDAIGAAYELIRRGDVQAMIAGGSEAIINPIGITGFNALNALSTRNDDPATASRPFDAERDGFVIGEGAGTLVLENREHALRRGARILAELVAYGASADAYHMTQPIETGEGAARAISLALAKSGLAPAQVDYINAHGTSTQLNDKMETRAIKQVFSEAARKVAVSSTKSMTGHLIGAAGAVEAFISVMAIREGIIPPTINLTHPDPECDLDYVPNIARRATVNAAMSTSFGFGGHNSALIFRKHAEA